MKKCPLTVDWVSPDLRPAHVILKILKRNAKRREQYAVSKQDKLKREQEDRIARRVMVPAEPFELK